MFQHTSNINIAESLFTGLYIVVSKTDSITDDDYNEFLSFLESQLNFFDIDTLVSDFISNKQFLWFNERINFSAKLKLGPTQILWNSNQKFNDHNHILNTSKAFKILKRFRSAKYFTNSKLQIKYITESKYNELPNLFYKHNVIASITLDEQSDVFTLIDLFYDKKETHGDRVPFHFLITKSDAVDKLSDEFEKYIVKMNLHKYRKFDTEDDEFIYDCFIFLSDKPNYKVSESGVDDLSIYENGAGYGPYLIYNSLREAVLNILISFVSKLATHFSNERYSLESVKKFMFKPSSHLHIPLPKKSTLKQNTDYNGDSVRKYAELYLLINKRELAINLYILSSYLFNTEANVKEYCRTLFGLAVAIFTEHLSKLSIEVDGGSEPVSWSEHEYNTTGNVAADVTNAVSEFDLEGDSTSRSLDNKYIYPVADVNNLKVKYDKQDKYTTEGVNKDISEKPFSYVLFYLNKCFKLWIKTDDSSRELELLFAFYVNILSKIKTPFITKVINSFIVYSTKLFSKQQQCNILRYIIKVVSKTKFKRKLLFYQYLLDEALNNGLEVDTEQKEYKYKDINYVIYNLVLVAHCSLNPQETSSFWNDLDISKYEHWYQIKNSIIDCQFAKLFNTQADCSNAASILNNGSNFTLTAKEAETTTNPNSKTHISHLSNERYLEGNSFKEDQLAKKVNKLILMKYLNMFNYLVDFRHFIDAGMFEQIKSEFIDTANQFVITHLVLSGQMCNPNPPITSSANLAALSGDKNHIVPDDERNGSEVCGTNLVLNTHLGNNLFLALKSIKRSDTVASFLGGFEDLQFKNFPVVYSIKLWPNNYNYNYSNIKRVEHTYSITPTSNQHCFVLKGSYKHFKIKPTHTNNTIQPKCSILNKRFCINYRCAIVKSRINDRVSKRPRTVSYKIFHGSFDSKHTIDNHNSLNNNDNTKNTLNSDMNCSNKKKYVEYIYDTVDKVVYVDKELEVEIRLDNPFPFPLLLKNVNLMTIGCNCHSSHTVIEVPPFKRDFKHNLKIVIREPGLLYIYGLSFLLFDTLQCYQLLFNDLGLITHLLSKYENDDNFQESLKNDTHLMERLKESAVLNLKAINNYNKSKMNVYVTDFNNFYTDTRFKNFYSINSNRSLSKASRLSSRLSMNNSVYDSARSNFSRLTRSITTSIHAQSKVGRRISIGNKSHRNCSITSRISSITTKSANIACRNTSINTRTTSNNASIINIDSIKSDMISWLRVPRFGAGTVLKHLRLCLSYSCSYCNIFYSYYDSLSATNRSHTGPPNSSDEADTNPTSTTSIDSVHTSHKAVAGSGLNESKADNYRLIVDSADNLTVDGMINGEIKLIYVKLSNENSNHSFTNIKATPLPYCLPDPTENELIDEYRNEVYGPKRRIIKNISIGDDYVEEKLRDTKSKHIKEHFYSNFIIILNDHCQLVRNDSKLNDNHPSNYHDITGNICGLNSNHLVVAPNETLYLPIIYKCNDIINNFNVILDYSIVDSHNGYPNDSDYSNSVKQTTAADKDSNAHACSADAESNTEPLDTSGDRTTTTKKGFVYKNIVINSKKSLEIKNIKFENIVQFNLNHFLFNVDEFRHIFKNTTLSAFKNYSPIFDQKCVQVFISIKNKSNTNFNCTINKTNFVSDSNNTQRWSVRLRRIDYSKNIDLHEFAQLVLAHLQVKWTCDLNKIGITNMYNLNDLLNDNIADNSTSKLTHKCYTLPNGLCFSNIGTHRLTTFEKLIIKNVNNIVMSRLSIQLSVSTDGETGSAKEVFNTNTGSKFTFNVLVKNNSNEVINDFKVVIVPFNSHCYNRIDGVKYTGCLEQLGSCPIIPLGEHTSTNARDTLNTNGYNVDDPVHNEVKDGCNSSLNEWDYYLNVASVDFVANEACSFGINAAIILNKEKTIHWHHTPLHINVD